MKNISRSTLIKLVLLCVAAYVVGVASFFFYHDMVAKNTYVSENALMPGSGRLVYSGVDLQKAQQLTSMFLSTLLAQSSEEEQDESSLDFLWRSKCADWISRAFEDRGLDTHVYWTDTKGVVITGIQRAGKGDGTEGIALSTIFTHNSNVTYTRNHMPDTAESSNVQGHGGGGGHVHVGGVGMLLSISDSFRECKWLSKDIVYVFSDSSDSISQWLQAYHKGELPLWGGALQAAIHVGVRPWPIGSSKNRYHDPDIVVYLEGSNGQLPNLDMVNTLTQFARVHHLRTSITLPITPLGKYFDDLVRLVAHKTGLPAITQEMKYLLAFMLRQAIGVPLSSNNGPHAYFNQYNIDAISLDVERNTELDVNYEAGGGSVALPLAVLGMVRSLNNLLEKLHQSFYYYLLYNPTRYVSIGNYMISLGLILTPMLVYTLYGLYWLSSSSDSYDSGQLARDQRTANQLAQSKGMSPGAIVVNAVAAVILHLGGVALYGVPILFGVTTQTMWSMFATSALFSFAITYFSPVNPSIFLLFTTLPTVVFISSMSLLNFSFCVFVAAIVVPIYTSIAVLHHRVNVILQLVLVVISTPTVLYLVGLASHISTPYDVFKTLLDHHAQHGALLYPFLTLVYTPLNLGYFFVLWKGINK